MVLNATLGSVAAALESVPDACLDVRAARPRRVVPLVALRDGVVWCLCHICWWAPSDSFPQAVSLVIRSSCALLQHANGWRQRTPVQPPTRQSAVARGCTKHWLWFRNSPVHPTPSHLTPSHPTPSVLLPAKRLRSRIARVADRPRCELLPQISLQGAGGVQGATHPTRSSPHAHSLCKRHMPM